MGVVLNWSSAYPASIDDLVTNYPAVSDNTHDVLASHVNELASAVVALQNVAGGLRAFPIEEPMSPSVGDVLVYNNVSGEWEAGPPSGISFSLQDAYDDGATIAQTTGKPVAITTFAPGEDGITVTDGSDTVTIRGDEIQLPAGSAAAPSLLLGTATPRGFYSDAVHEIGVSTNSVERMSWKISSITFGNPLQGADGSSSATTYSFAGDPTAGLYRAVSTQLHYNAPGHQFETGGAVRFVMATGSFYPATDDLRDLGLTAARWRGLHLSGQVINTVTSIVADEALFDFSGTVNKVSGTNNYTGIKLDVLETAAPGTDDRLMDLKVGGTTWFKISNIGRVHAGGVGGTPTTPSLSFNGAEGMGFQATTVSQMGWSVTGINRLNFAAALLWPAGDNSMVLGVSTLRFKDLHLAGQVINTVTSIVADEALFDFSGTVNKVSGTNNYTGIKLDVLETLAPGADDRLLDLQVGSTSKFRVTNAGLVLAADGDQTAPTYTFISDATHGLYLHTTDNVGIAVAGLRVVSFVAGQTLSQGGTAALPSVSFIGDPDTGMYANSADDHLYLSTGGVVGLTLNQLLNHASADEVFLDLTAEVSKVAGEYTGIKLNVTETLSNGTDSRLLELGVGGTPLMYVTNGGHVRVEDGLPSAPTYSFIDAIQTGMFRDAGVQVAFVWAGTRALALNSTNVRSYLSVLGPDGTLSLPTYSFTSQTDTGSYLNNTTIPTWGLSVEGADAMLVRRVLDDDGFAEAFLRLTPTVTHNTGTYTGILLDVDALVVEGTDDRLLDLKVSGTSQMYVTDDGRVLVGDGVDGTHLSLSGVNDPNTGISFNIVGDTVRFLAGGATRFDIASTCVAYTDLRGSVDTNWDLGSPTIRWGAVHAGPGTNSLPALAVAFSTAGANGFYAPAADNVALSIGGEALMTWDEQAPTSAAAIVHTFVSITGDGGGLTGGSTGYTLLSADINQDGSGGGTELLLSLSVESTAKLTVSSAGTLTFAGDLDHDGSNVGFYGNNPAPQSAAYTRNATIVVSRVLLASASATIINNNNVLAALIADLQATGYLA